MSLSPGDAARLCRKDEATIRRALRRKAIPGAHRLGDNPGDRWSIPAAGLVEAGLCSVADVEAYGEEVPPDVSDLQGRVAELEVQLDAALAREAAAVRLLEQSMAETEHLRRVVDRLLEEPRLKRSA